MITKKSARLFFSAVFCLTAAASITAATPDTSTAPATPNAFDEDLILEDEPAPSPQPAVPQTPPPVPAAIVSKPAGDTAIPTAAQQSPKPQSERDSSKNKIVDEELILDGGAEDLLGQEKAQAKAAAKLAGSTKTDSTGGVDSAAKAGVLLTKDTASVAAPTGSATDTAARSTVSGQSVAAVTVPATIEKPHSINFAKNLKEYRSPKLAMLMSLILPGSGQVYSRSSLWGAAFVGIEAAVIGAGWVFISKSKDRKKEAYSYADAHYHVENFEKYCGDLKTYLRNKYGDSAKTIYTNEIFFGDGDVIFLADAKDKNDDYYSTLTSGQSQPYIRGWDDVKPEFGGGGMPHGDPSWGVDDSAGGYLAFPKQDSTNRGYGFSGYQNTYAGMIAQSRHLANIGRNIYMSLLFNHLVSAVAAGVAAKRHNDELLRKETFWRRIDIERHYVNTGSETVPGYSLAVRF